MTIRVDGVEYISEEREIKADHIEMWYDRHRREWVLYPVDTEGNQIHEARYGFGKADALATKKALEEEFMGGASLPGRRSR